MIVVRLIGGLGNQMFQYAAGRALALRHETALFIDKTAFQSYTLHDYGLQHFALQAHDAPPTTIPYRARFPAIGRILQYLQGHEPLAMIKEKSFTFDPDILTLHDGIYLDGYWQSEKYFSDVAEVIRGDFQIQTPSTPENHQWINRIRSSMAVSLHVRRGDYVSTPATNQFHGTCSPAYYREAMDKMAENLPASPTFFVFSDDPLWVQKNLDFGPHNHAFVTGNDADKNFEDLRLMSACQHHIIANSTFSWWGAWLNPSQEKRVIAPRRWFATESMSARDLIPESWQTL